MLICIVGGIDFDHLSKVVNCRIHSLKFTIFPFIISKYFKIENLRLCIYPVLASTSTCSFSFPPWILPMAIPMVILYFSHSLYINQNFPQGLFFHYSLIYSVIYMGSCIFILFFGLQSMTIFTLLLKLFQFWQMRAL